MWSHYKKNRSSDKSEGIVLDVGETLFYFLGKLSIFELVRRLVKPKNGYDFVDRWVLGHLIMSTAISILVYSILENKILLYILSIYSFIRVFEIVIYQINVNLFGVYRAKLNNKHYKVKSNTRMVVLLICNFIEIIFWYLIIIVSIVKLSEGQCLYTYKYYFQTSLFCFTTSNYEAIAGLSKKKFRLLSWLATCEAISGFIMTIISLANFIGRLPSENIIEEEK